MSPLSNDPELRARQLANLVPGQGANRPGQRRYVKHGAYARLTDAELDTKTRELVEAIGDDLPVRETDGGVPAADGIAIRMLAETMIRRERVRLEELRHGFEAPDGSLRGIVEFGLRLDERALSLLKEMGLTPAARAKLGLTLARTQRTLEDEIAAAPDWDDVVDGEVAS
jgi:hypothetical protein